MQSDHHILSFNSSATDPSQTVEILHFRGWTFSDNPLLLQELSLLNTDHLTSDIHRSGGPTLLSHFSILQTILVCTEVTHPIKFEVNYLIFSLVNFIPYWHPLIFYFVNMGVNSIKSREISHWISWVYRFFPMQVFISCNHKHKVQQVHLWPFELLWFHCKFRTSFHSQINPKLLRTTAGFVELPVHSASCECSSTGMHWGWLLTKGGLIRYLLNEPLSSEVPMLYLAVKFDSCHLCEVHVTSGKEET